MIVCCLSGVIKDNNSSVQLRWPIYILWFSYSRVNLAEVLLNVRKHLVYV